MRILYAYTMDPRDPNVQSGRPFSIYQRMVNAGHEVDVLVIPHTLRSRVTMRKAWSLLRGRRYGTERSVRNSKAYAKVVRKTLQQADAPYDVVFSPSTYVFADLRYPIAKVACVDTLFEDLISTYYDRSRVDTKYLIEGNAHELRALSNLELLIVPSAMARDVATNFYNVPAEKVVLAPFGGNLKRETDRSWIDAAINERAATDQINLLFIGREWDRKNGALVAATSRVLRERSVAVHVDYVGVEQPRDFPIDLLPISRFHGQLDLRRSDEDDDFLALARRATFFFTPSRAEAFGMAFVEAASLGLPMIGGDVGGLRDIITPATGRLIDPLADPTAVADTVMTLFEDRAAYRAMGQAARLDSEERLNWLKFWAKCEPRIEQVAAARRS